MHQRLKRLLLISIDLLRPGEPSVSLPIGSLLAFARHANVTKPRFEIDHLRFNLASTPRLTALTILHAIISRYRLRELDAIAVSCYVWSDFLINPLIRCLRNEGFRGTVVLGGPQVNSECLDREYPDCQVFIRGHGEASLLRVLEDNHSHVLDVQPNLRSMPSPYLTGEIVLVPGQAKVNTETKRGCPYRCTFCAHRDLQRSRLYRYPRERVMAEMRLFADKGVAKVNIVDPVFNVGPDYLWILEQVTHIAPQYLIALQARFENIRGASGKRFLELCSILHVCLEFGLQTVVPNEYLLLERRNHLSHISSVMRSLNERQIPYEVSLIYGLPLQTPESFEYSIRFLQTNGCQVIKAFPLMLLKGTKLFAQKDVWQFQERQVGPYQIPVVVSSKHMREQEWEEMRSLAASLATVERV